MHVLCCVIKISVLCPALFSSSFFFWGGGEEVVVVVLFCFYLDNVRILVVSFGILTSSLIAQGLLRTHHYHILKCFPIYVYMLQAIREVRCQAFHEVAKSY